MAANSSAGVYVTETDESQIARAASTSVAVLMGESSRGPVVPTLVTSTKRFLSLYGIPDPTLGFMHYAALQFLTEGDQLYVLRVAPNARSAGITIGTGLTNLNTATPWTSSPEDPATFSVSDTDLFTIYAKNPGAWGNGLSIRVYPNTLESDGTFFIEVYEAGLAVPTERHLVSIASFVDGFGIQRNVQEFINRRSSLIQVKQNLTNTRFVADPNQVFINTLNNSELGAGVDGARPTTGNFITALTTHFSDPEEVKFNILINGGLDATAIKAKMLEICSNRKDCFAILDMPSLEQDVESAITYRRETLNANTSYGAIYTPDLKILDEYNNRRLYVPPSGHVAAAYARTDSNAAVWFAPAGIDRGTLSILETRHIYNQGDRDAFDPNQINPIRVINGVGTAIWGAETLQSKKSALSNINVRRLVIFLEDSLSEAALYSVFNPNDEILRMRLREICERFLKPIKNGQGLYNYGVQCDEDNNPPELVAAGDLALRIFLDPTLPAKRIILNAIINKTGATFTE